MPAETICNMTPEAQQIAIAEACGYIVRISPSSDYRVWVEAPPTRGMFVCPDYLSDLNAMHEAETCLPGGAHGAYACMLHESVFGRKWMCRGYLDAFVILRATAAQRAEAFLRTIGKWRESK